jgi:hypothetical protein
MLKLQHGFFRNEAVECARRTQTSHDAAGLPEFPKKAMDVKKSVEANAMPKAEKVRRR